MVQIEAFKTNSNYTSINVEGISYSNKDESPYIKKEEDFFSVKEFSASTSTESSFNKEASTLKSEKDLQVIKRKVLSMLINEDIIVGYSSMTEVFLNELLEKDPSLTKEVINRLYVENIEKPIRLQKIIEVMSNLDYKKMYPTNIILALGVINNVDVAVQEAAIAAYEKWEDPKNISVLKSTKYTVEWIEDYAKEVIDYLEGC